jgi:hypothetical protein
MNGGRQSKKNGGQQLLTWTWWWISGKELLDQRVIHVTAHLGELCVQIHRVDDGTTRSTDGGGKTVGSDGKTATDGGSSGIAVESRLVPTGIGVGGGGFFCKSS